MLDYISSVRWWTILSDILFKVFHWYSCVIFLSDFLFAALIILDALGMKTLFQKANINNFPSIPCIISLNSGVTVHSYMVARSSGLYWGCCAMFWITILWLLVSWGWRISNDCQETGISAVTSVARTTDATLLRGCNFFWPKNC